MKYLFTCTHNKKKALAITSHRNGLTFDFNGTKVTAALVNKNASNAINLRMKINDQIKAFASVPSLIIPWTLKAKSGSDYTDPQGITWYQKYYNNVIYDKEEVSYYALSANFAGIYHSGQAIVGYCYLAHSIDGINWTETDLSETDYYITEYDVLHLYSYGQAGFISTKQGKYLICIYGAWNYDTSLTSYWYVLIKVFKLENGNCTTIYQELLYTTNSSTASTPVCTITTASDEYLDFGLFTIYTQQNTQYKNYIYRIYNDTVTKVYTDTDYNQNRISFNTKLHTFMYGNKGSYDGLTFDQSIPHMYSYGPIAGKELIVDANNNAGLSDDGLTISETFTRFPLGFDPIDEKYIAAYLRNVPTGQGSGYITYVDIYLSKDLQNWTLLSSTTDIDFPAYLSQELRGSSKGFACVEGF